MNAKTRTHKQLEAVATYAWFHDADHVDVNLHHAVDDLTFYYQVRNGRVREITKGKSLGIPSIKLTSASVAAHVMAQLAAFVRVNGYSNPPHVRSFPRRAWINAPSTAQPMHDKHGTNVLAMREVGGTRIYYLDGETISSHVPDSVVSDGWLPRARTADDITRPVSEAAARDVLRRLRDDAQALHVRLEALLGAYGGALAVLRLYNDTSCAVAAAADLREALDF